MEKIKRQKPYVFVKNIELVVYNINGNFSKIFFFSVYAKIIHIEYESLNIGERRKLTMNKEQFLEYVRENFTLDGTSQRLIASFVDYVCAQSDDDETKWAILYSVLDSFGMELEEVKQLKF